MERRVGSREAEKNSSAARISVSHAHCCIVGEPQSSSRRLIIGLLDDVTGLGSDASLKLVRSSRATHSTARL